MSNTNNNTMTDYIKVEAVKIMADWCTIEYTNLDTGKTGFDSWERDTETGKVTSWAQGSAICLVNIVGEDKAREYAEAAINRPRKYIIIEA